MRHGGAGVSMRDRFDLYGALWALCSRWHSGQASRGYRILSRLSIAGYNPGMGLQAGRFESNEQRSLYRHLLRRYRRAI
jgi:hypothetical protein